MGVVLAVLVVLALVVSALAAVLAVASLRLARELRSRRRDSPIPTDLQGLRSEVAALRTEVSDALRHLAVVRYDAFGDMGGHLSWSLALLDDSGNGVVVTSIHGRSEARTYAKNVSAWSCDQAISPEEEEAITVAKAS
jgi:Protein of unknown function (DUF4446)